VAQFKYLEMTVTNQNLIPFEIKERLNLRNACYHSYQNQSIYRLQYKKVKIGMYENLILPVDLYGCETWFLTLTELHRLRVFKRRVLRRIFGPKRDEVTGG
jgi:hypothetical protein